MSFYSSPISSRRRRLSATPSVRLLYLDQIAAEGVRFNQAYTVNAICSPTRASLFTGMLPNTHGMVDCTHTVNDYRAKFQQGLTL